jgi:uncharacterized membrane protein YfcA
LNWIIHSSVADVAFSGYLLLGLGFIAGFLSGLLGVGGGWLVTPALNFLGLPMAGAIGTGIAQVFGTSFFALLRHFRSGSPDFKLGLAIGIPMVFSVQGGKHVLLLLTSGGIAEVAVRGMFVLLLGSLGTFMFIEAQRAGKTEPSGTTSAHYPWTGLMRKVRMLGPRTHIPSIEGDLGLPFLASTGVIAGFLSGLLGIGGGFILVPIFIYLCDVPTRRAVATSLISLTLASSFGSISFFQSGLVDVDVALVLLLGSVAGSYLGVAASHYAPPVKIRLIFSAFLLASALSMVLAAGGFERIGKGLLMSTAIVIPIALAAVSFRAWRADGMRNS